MKLTGAQIILKKLRKHNIDRIFEFPGGSICPILDEVYRDKAIKTMVFKHEQAAIHAAEGFARASKQTSVCMATSGPGASNLVTGIANAFMDSVPIVVITGQVAVWDLKRHHRVRQRGFQELDIVSVVKTITKAAFLVRQVSDLAETLEKAFFIAKEGRPGPVLVDVPINVQYTHCDYREEKNDFKTKKIIFSDSVIREMAKRLLSAKRPLVLAGGGINLAGAEKALNILLEKFKLPVAQTLLGISSVPNNYEFNLGLVGYAGSQISSLAIKEADFILGLGLRFDNRAFPQGKKEFAKKTYIAHVDCDKNELNHRLAVDKAICADVKIFLNKLLHELKNNKCQHKEWLEFLRNRIRRPEFSKSSLTPQYILDRLSTLLKNKKIIVTTDVGQHQLWTAQYFKFNRPNSLITSGGLGTMGFGLPAAIGAQISHPNAEVFNITSDGSIQMNIQEMATISSYKLPIKIILLNNLCLGLVRQIQEFAFSGRYESTRLNSSIDFVNIAKAYGIEAISIKSAGEVERALRKVVVSKKSILADFRINEFENVFPVRIKGKILYSGAKS